MIYDIEIKNATVSYRENVALKNISLRIKKNSFVVVVGPNGAGKTTLLTLVNGLGTLRSGTIKIFGKVVNYRNGNAIRREIGYVPQHVLIDPRMPISVYDVVMLGRYGKIGLFRQPNTVDRNIVDDVCELVDINHLRKKPIGHLSGGEMQKVSLARALAQEPKILMLDEPIANLDPRAQSDIIDLIEQIYTEKKLVVLFVTHILNNVPRVCTDAVLIKNGSIVASGNIRDVFTKKLLSELYTYPVEPPTMHRTERRV
jgi:ABC-type Mn2+/Zn2+ transport system ATPase subunit